MLLVFWSFQIVAALTSSEDPDFNLQPRPCPIEGFELFDQLNVKLTRKQMLPIVRAVGERQDSQSATGASHDKWCKILFGTGPVSVVGVVIAKHYMLLVGRLIGCVCIVSGWQRRKWSCKSSFGVWCDDENILNKGKVIMKIIFFRL